MEPAPPPHVLCLTRGSQVSEAPTLRCWGLGKFSQLAARFAQRIQTGLLATGARLPSVRQCAQQQGVSPSTVVAAYDQLLAQGLVEAHKNRGFYIRNRAPALTQYAQPATDSVAYQASGTTQPVPPMAQQRAPVNATALIRGMFQGSSKLPQPRPWAAPGLVSPVERVVYSRQPAANTDHRWCHPCARHCQPHAVARR